MSQPFNHLSFQWQVIDKIATPKNPKGDEPYVRDCICSDCLQDNRSDADEFEDFEQFAAAHKMETDAEPGTYEGSKFQLRWQYNNTGVADGFWSYATNPSNYKSFENYAENTYYPTRQFLEYIGEAKGEEFSIIATESQIKQMGDAVTVLADFIAAGIHIEDLPPDVKHIVLLHANKIY